MTVLSVLIQTAFHSHYWFDSTSRRFIGFAWEQSGNSTESDPPCAGPSRPPRSPSGGGDLALGQSTGSTGQVLAKTEPLCPLEIHVNS